MPSTATITAFYTFAANTKARASLVNANFDIFRGHLLPLSPSTATCADNTYDLGSSEYRWRLAHLSGISVNTATSQLDIFSAGSTIASISQTKATFVKNTLFSSSIADGTALTNTAYSLLATLSVTSYGGNMQIMIAGVYSTFASYFQMQVLTSTVTNPRLTLDFYRDSTSTVLWSTLHGGGSPGLNHEFPANFNFIDSSCSSGNHTYYLYGTKNYATNYLSIIIGGGGMRFQALELK